VMGDRHALYQSKFVDLFGVANQLDYGASVMVDGVGNSLRQLYDTAINGDENVVSFTSHASIVGSNNHVMMGDGQYIGSKNRHFGGGEPIVIGDQNVLFGHQSHIVDSDRSMIIGSSDQPDEFNLDDSIILLAHGGVDIIHHGVTVAHLAEGAGSWGHVSDRDLKINIQPINQSKVLETMLSLSVSEWRYKGQDYIQHIGPMAQDFYQLFQFGNDDRFINSVDIDGVILASIQGLGSDVVEFRSQKELLLASAHNQNQKMLAFIRDKEGVIVSANLLSEQALDIHERYERLHHLEIDQRLAIESLNERIVRVKEYLEKCNEPYIIWMRYSYVIIGVISDGGKDN